MKQEDCKEGVRVYWDKGQELGTIVTEDGSIFPLYEQDSVWVEWDDNKEVLHINYESLTVLDSSQENKVELTEEQAVMFLMSKGYTISKGK
jgi:hypothetical protein